jgi:hypothetical protein
MRALWINLWKLWIAIRLLSVVTWAGAGPPVITDDGSVGTV